MKLKCYSISRFRIALRQISASEVDINEAVENFKEKGFINYYGHQRFGNHASVPTHQIGLFLVQSNFKKVAQILSHLKDTS